MKDTKSYADADGIREEWIQRLFEEEILKETDVSLEDDKQSLQICAYLYSIEVDMTIIRSYMHYIREDKNTIKKRLQLLHVVRKEALQKMHHAMEALYCIDHLRKDLFNTRGK